MKKYLCVLIAVLVGCAALVTVPATGARAQTNTQADAGDCTRQGALIMALAEMLKLDVEGKSVAEVGAMLAARGIEPPGGWNPDACLTKDAEDAIRMGYGNVGVERAFDTYRQYLPADPGQQHYPTVSPAKP
jgi:hypothetical protein